MIVLIDNYDSFTYNLYQLAGKYAQEGIKVIRNDEMSVSELERLNPTHIMISPGPGRPADAGITIETIKQLADKIPILGICLGHQAICEAYGGKVSYAEPLVHGKKSTIHIASGNQIFRGLPPILDVGRYHSLIAERESLPEGLLVIAETDKGELMGVKHRDYPLYGLQFHPESILTPQGERIIENFIRIGGKRYD